MFCFFFYKIKPGYDGMTDTMKAWTESQLVKFKHKHLFMCILITCFKKYEQTPKTKSSFEAVLIRSGANGF